MTDERTSNGLNGLSSLHRALSTAKEEKEKIFLLEDFFLTIDVEEIGISLDLLLGHRPTALCSVDHLFELCFEASGLPRWLFNEAMEAGGDVFDCMANIFPDTGSDGLPALKYVLNNVRNLQGSSTDEKDGWILDVWRRADSGSRYFINKLVASRIDFPVTGKEIATALSNALGLDYAATLKFLISRDPGSNIPDAIRKEKHDGDARGFPEFEQWEVLRDHEFQHLNGPFTAEKIYSGIRAQVVVHEGEVSIWTGSGELLDRKFPEIVEDVLSLGRDVSLEGWLLAFDGAPQAKEILEARLKRKRVTPSLVRSSPVLFMVSRVRTIASEVQKFGQGRELLEDMLSGEGGGGRIMLSEQMELKNMQELQSYLQSLREHGAEAALVRPLPFHERNMVIMFRAPLMRLKLLLIYAETQGWSINEPSLSFGIRHGNGILPFTRTGIGLDDADYEELMLWVRENTLERYGPVRSVPAEQLFEIGFERIYAARRKKCGLDVANPRILRWLKDASAEEADTLDNATALL